MKNKIRTIVSILVFCVLLVFCGKMFRYLLVDDSGSYTKVTFHEMYEQDNIDVLFVGSSHCYRTFIPGILDEELGLNTFNVGTSSQQMDGSFMVIREAARYNDMKHIYLEIYYHSAFDIPKSRTQMTQTYIISDYLKPSIDKVIYLLNASGKEQYVNSFITARRNWSKLYDFDYIKNVISKKSTDAYKSYDYTNITGDTEWYAGKGYVANNIVVDNWNYFSTRGWEAINLDNVSQDWINSLTGIMDFCENNGIELTLIGAPMSNFLNAGNGNYDEYIELVNGLIEGRPVDYYDFNLCREEYLPNTSELFKDEDHVNCYGAETFSRSFAKLVNNEVSSDDMFYGSYADKLANLKSTVFGISYQDENADDRLKIRKCKIVSTETPRVEYQVQIEPEEGESYIVQDFSENTYFEISSEIKGIIRVFYREIDAPKLIHEVSITIQS